MSKDSTDIDSVPGAISELYREVATETAPADLDETVLAEARQAVRQGSPASWPWYRPVIFIGLFGLSLALLLEFIQLTGTDAETGVEQRVEAIAGSETRLVPKTECTEDEREDATSWWTCIQDLEAGGQSSAAEEELRNLMAAFPGFNSSPPAER